MFLFFLSLLWSSGSLNVVKGNFILEEGANKHPLVGTGEDPAES